MKIILKLALLSLLFSPLALFAADAEVEEVVVTGSQIKGAKITGALPVSILSGEDIEAIGVDSGDDLIENIVEQGQNYFTEAEDASGGVNASRGDMGAYNLRNLGVGNTLTLLNGRRLVTSPGYQTELIGGDYVPTASVNSNLIPVTGIERLEILRDGASAIYGADAVAGVINNVLQKDFEGLTPLSIPDYKGLSGDASDNIKGIPGIGKKAANSLLNKYKNLEEIYENIDKIIELNIRGAKRIQSLLIEHKKEAKSEKNKVVELQVANKTILITKEN